MTEEKNAAKNQAQQPELPGDEELTKLQISTFDLVRQFEFLRSPEECIKKWRPMFRPDALETLQRSIMETAVNEAAKKTGAAPADLADPKKRTKEQQRAIDEALQALEQERTDGYNNSQYLKAIIVINSLGLDIDDDTVKYLAALYFVQSGGQPGSPEPLPEKANEKLEVIAREYIKQLKKAKKDAEKNGYPATETFMFVRAFSAMIDSLYKRDQKAKAATWLQAEAKETVTGEASAEGATFFDKVDATETVTGAAAAQQPQQLELFPLISPITAKWHIMTNSLVMNDLESGKTPRILPGHNEYDLHVFGEKSELTTYIAITYEPDPESGITIKGPERLTAYERAVFNAVVSLWVAAQKAGYDRPTITPEMIYKAMPGGSERIPAGQRGAIGKVINKLRQMRIYIDATDEMHKRGVTKPNEAFRMDAACLMITHVQRRVRNGQTVHAYRIEAEPIIYTYSKAVKQLLSIPAKCLDIRQLRDGKITEKPVRMSGDRQAIADYLLRRIARMKEAQNKKQNESRYILFSELFKVVSAETLNRFQEKDYRDFCFDVLEYQTAAGYIKGYKPIKEGRKIAKVEILL